MTLFLIGGLTLHLMLVDSLQIEYTPGSESKIDQDDWGNNLVFWGCLGLTGWNVGWKIAVVYHEIND